MDFTRVVHGSQEYSFAPAPSRGRDAHGPGAAGFRPASEDANGFLTIALDLVDESGAVGVHVSIHDDRTIDLSPRSFDEVTVGEVLPELRRVVTAADVKAYADVSATRTRCTRTMPSPVRWASTAIIAHGMFTMGHMAQCVVAWAGGDPATIDAISASFRAPVLMGEEIVAGGTVRSLDRQGRTAIVQTWVSVERDGTVEYPIKRGEAHGAVGLGSVRLRPGDERWTSPGSRRPSDRSRPAGRCRSPRPPGPRGGRSCRPGSRRP